MNELVLSLFYQKQVEFFFLFYSKKRDWHRLLALHDQYLWPVLRTLADPSLSIYADAPEGDCTAFIKSIRDEIDLRLNKPSTSADRDRYLQILIENSRIPILVKIFDLTPDDINDFKSGNSKWVNWLIAGGTAIAVTGLAARAIIIKNGKPVPKEKK